jgi:hypothetical protein
MSLKYSDKPQYGRQQAVDVWSRYPRHARPIATAPVTATPVKVYDASGKAQYALYHGGFWRTGQNFRDPWGGPARWRLDGGQVSQATMWST